MPQEITAAQAGAIEFNFKRIWKDNKHRLPPEATEDFINKFLEKKGDIVALAQFDIFLWHLKLHINHALQEKKQANKK
ncbi:MAG: hypothetical protein WC793_01055 [Candidatus Paceibacterota bacterium]|jgi:hypothetical protein